MWLTLVVVVIVSFVGVVDTVGGVEPAATDAVLDKAPVDGALASVGAGVEAALASVGAGVDGEISSVEVAIVRTVVKK